MIVRLCRLANTLFDSLAKSIYTLPDEGKEREKFIACLSRQSLEAVILP